MEVKFSYKRLRETKYYEVWFTMGQLQSKQAPAREKPWFTPASQQRSWKDFTVTAMNPKSYLYTYDGPLRLICR